MNDEIKEILSYLKKKENTRRIKCITIEESKRLLDYITNLQQEINKLTAESTEWESKYYEMQDNFHNANEEIERLNNCIDDQERVINSLIDKRDLYKINYNDYKYRCEKAVEYINNFSIDKSFSFPLMKRWEENQVKSSIEYEFNDNLKKDLLNILQNGSDSK